MSDVATPAAPAPSPVAIPNPASVPNVPPEVAKTVEAPAPAAAPPATPGPEAQTEEGQKDEKPRQKASERIGELYGRMKAAERRAVEAETELRNLRQPSVTQQQYEQMSYDDQQRVQIRQAVREERADQVRSEAERQAQEAAAARSAMFQTRVEEARAGIPDLDVIFSPHVPISDVGARFVAESDKGVEVAYWLAKNQHEARRIASLDPIAQAYELGRVEQRLAVAPTVRKVSNAPSPVPTIGGGSSAAGKDPASMTMSEYTAWRKAGGG